MSLKTAELFKVYSSVTEVESGYLFKMQPEPICSVGSPAEH